MQFLKKINISSYIIIITTIITLLSSCNKTDCLGDAGEITIYKINVGNFNSIQIFDTFDIYIVQDSLNIIEIELEKEFIEQIKVINDDSSLIITNENKCRFLQNSGNVPKITVHITDIDSAIFREYGRFYSKDTINTKRFLLKFIAEAGYANFIVNTEHLAVSIWGKGTTGEFYVKGKTTYLQILNDGTSFVYADSLIANYTTIHNTSRGDVKISPIKTISASIYKSGNIFYTGNPEIKLIEEFSTGKLIKLD